MSDIGQRKYDRVPSKVLAQLRLEDGRVQDGITRDMGFGGIFLHTPLPPLDILRGTRAKLVMTLFDRPVELSCHVAHTNQEGIGIQLERVSLE
ncbi:MAG: PilZ domain-containing protein [Magnetococcales bacterium]|nr:PilZ domain-containing protein [Magnetococcales bacterium]NGZ26296.1 PilZ domain-containing protein [Magnetococcales bacterium]NGZ27240.1 PilZ domain-containing protein [Magnetococcales bacterium]